MLRIHHAFCDATANVRVWRTWGTAAQRDALARREDLRAPTGAAPAISGPNFEFRGAICGRLKLVAGPYNAPTGAYLPSVFCEPAKHALPCWWGHACTGLTRSCSLWHRSGRPDRAPEGRGLLVVDIDGV